MPEFTFLIDSSRFGVALSAIALVSLFGLLSGPFFSRAVPFLWQFFDQTIGVVGARLDRKERKRKDLTVRGAIVTLFAFALALGLGGIAAKLIVYYPFNGGTEVIILSVLLASGTVWHAMARLYITMRDKKTGQGAYLSVARSLRHDLSVNDDFGITRAAMGLAARIFDKAMVAPLFWYFIGGFKLAFLYAGCAAIAWRFGKEGHGKGFGVVPLGLEKVMGYVPNLITGILLAIAGLFTPTAGMTRAFIGLCTGKNKAPYNEGGAVVTAVAYALDVSIGGPAKDLDGSTLKRKWVGAEGATAQIAEDHLRRCLYLFVMAHLLLVALILTVMLLLD